MQHIHEDRVRALAYQIWESEGKPIGHEYRHWEMASMLALEQGGEKLKKVATTASDNGAAETFNIDPDNNTVINAGEPAPVKSRGRKSAKQN